MFNLEEILAQPKLPPTDDLIFKSLFTREDTKISLMSLISAFTGIEIKSLNLKNTVLPVDSIFEKEEVFDVAAVTNDNEEIDIELQASPMKGDNFAGSQHKNLRCRSIYNVSDLYSAQKGRGIIYSQLKPAIQIMICNYNVFGEDVEMPCEFNYRTKNGVLLETSTTIIFVELKKFAKLSKQKPVNEMSKAELWALYLEFADNSEYKSLIMEIIKDREEFQVATSALNNISTDEELLSVYRSRQKSEMLHEHNMAVAKNEGLAEGMFQKAIETAKKAISKGISFDIISDITGLSEEEILKLSS